MNTRPGWLAVVVSTTLAIPFYFLAVWGGWIVVRDALGLEFKKGSHYADTGAAEALAAACTGEIERQAEAGYRLNDIESNFVKLRAACGWPDYDH